MQGRSRKDSPRGRQTLGPARGVEGQAGRETRRLGLCSFASSPYEPRHWSRHLRYRVNLFPEVVLREIHWQWVAAFAGPACEHRP
jgi:hypothetical protein